MALHVQEPVSDSRTRGCDVGGSGSLFIFSPSEWTSQVQFCFCKTSLAIRQKSDPMVGVPNTETKWWRGIWGLSGLSVPLTSTLVSTTSQRALRKVYIKPSSLWSHWVTREVPRLLRVNPSGAGACEGRPPEATAFPPNHPIPAFHSTEQSDDTSSWTLVINFTLSLPLKTTNKHFVLSSWGF